MERRETNLDARIETLPHPDPLPLGEGTAMDVIRCLREHQASPDTRYNQ